MKYICLDMLYCCRFVSISMGLCACSSAGHLSNHADIAPNHAGITFAISNTLVSYCHNLSEVVSILHELAPA